MPMTSQDATRTEHLPSPDGGYTASDIVVLTGLEAVRRAPSMYIGSTGMEGLHRLVSELVDNAVDEAVAGYCAHVAVVLHQDGSCSVLDDGRGLPVDPHSSTGRPACEVVLTTLHAGGKFEGRSYVYSAGLHGVGLSCVNALAQWLTVDVWRDGAHYRQRFVAGSPVGDLSQVGLADQRGTRIRFQPDGDILDCVEFSAQVVQERLEELSYLHPGLSLTLEDERLGTRSTFRSSSGVRGLLQLRNRDSVCVHTDPVVLHRSAGRLTVDLAMQWTEGYAEEIHAYVNSVRTDHGGSHVDGLRSTLVTVINRYAARQGLMDGAAGERVSAADLFEGLTVVLAVRMRSPRFDGQTKRRLQSPEVGTLVGELIEQEFAALLERDGELSQQIVSRALDATRARLAARLASRTARFQRREVQVDYQAYRRQFGIRSRNWHESCNWLTDDGLLQQHAALCDIVPEARMLDVCCGSGVVGNAFKGRVGQSVGLDITPEMVRLASSRLDQVHLGTVYDLPFKNEEFDLVVNREVLHLLPQPEKPVSEIYRVLRPGGQFIVGQIMPYADEDAYWMFRIFKKKQPLLFQMFREQDFRRLLLNAGFVDVQMREYLLWESIDRWIDTHETTPMHRQQIYRLYYEAPKEVREVHPFEVASDGSVRDCWRWCVYSVRKPT
jgi:DNA gyrase subunit B